MTSVMFSDANQQSMPFQERDVAHSCKDNLPDEILRTSGLIQDVRDHASIPRTDQTVSATETG